MKLPVLILGAGGHSKVLIHSLRCVGAEIHGILDRDPAKKGFEILGAKVLGDEEFLGRWDPKSVELVNGVGSIGGSNARKLIFQKMKAKGFSFVTVVDPGAIVATDVQLGEGAQVMAGAVIQPGTRIGANSIINTRSAVDHDCEIGSHAHIAPGCTLSGGVRVQEGAHLGTGTSVIQGVVIGAGAVVGVGSAVVGDIAPGVTVFGVPARLPKESLGP